MLLPRRLVALVAAGAVITALQVTASPPALGDAPQSAVAALMQSYNSATGLIGPSWWGAAVALSSVEAYRQATGDTQYDYAITAAFADNKPGNFTNNYLDDTAWWGLAWVQAYDATGNSAYLDMAKTDASYIHGYWDGTCGGGVWWNTARTYKNAIANELFLQLTASIHNRTPGDTTYLGWANAEWSWFNGSGLIDVNHLVNDGLTSACGSNHGTTWTYNQGVILAGLAELSTATGNTGLLATAQGIADAAVGRLTVNGILVDGCEPTSCGNDGSSFKGIFVRDLAAFAASARTSRYDAFLETQAASVQSRDMNGSSQIGVQWGGPIQGLTSMAQQSGVDALVASFTRWPTEAVRSGIAGKCLDIRSGGSTNGTAVQLYDCNGSAAQSWTAYGDGTLRAFGKCLDASGGGTANGTKLQLWDCNNTGGQKWQVVGSGFRGYASRRCLDDPAGTSANSTQLQLWDCNGSPAQQWAPPGGALSTVAATSTIQAETATAQSGTINEATTDTGGGQNVGAIGNGDWLEFAKVDFGSVGLHTLTARASSGAGSGVSGTVEVHLDSIVNPTIGSFSIASTGGWQTWRSIPAAIPATTGTHTVFLKFVTGSGQSFVNVNWVVFS